MALTPNQQDALRRLRVLQSLSRHDPMPVTDKALLADLQATDAVLRYSLTDVRRMLKYLHGHGLVILGFSDANSLYQPDNAGDEWLAAISSHGVDYLSGYGITLDGVYRD